MWLWWQWCFPMLVVCYELALSWCKLVQSLTHVYSWTTAVCTACTCSCAAAWDSTCRNRHEPRDCECSVFSSVRSLVGTFLLKMSALATHQMHGSATALWLMQLCSCLWMPLCMPDSIGKPCSRHSTECDKCMMSRDAAEMKQPRLPQQDLFGVGGQLAGSFCKCQFQ